MVKIMKSFVVIGLGRFGSAVATTLCNLGHEVLAIDKGDLAVQLVSNYVTHAVVADATDEAVMNQLGIRNFDVAIIAMGDDMQSSILVTLLLRDIGVPYIVSKAQSELHAKVLEKVGANQVVFPERDMGIRVANNLAMTKILDFIELSPDYSIVEISPPNHWVGKSLSHLDIRSKSGINVIAIKKGKNINISPKADDKFSKEDIIVVVGSNSDINSLNKDR